jgi:nitrite reductase (NADH) small subunit
MANKFRLGLVTEIPRGEGRTFVVDGHRVAVFHSREGHTFATQADCPHKGGPLADGLVGGTTLICPLHEWSFDLRSGMAINGTCGLRTYPVTTGDDGMLTLEMEEGGGQPPWRVTDYTKT